MSLLFCGAGLNRVELFHQRAFAPGHGVLMQCSLGCIAVEDRNSFANGVLSTGNILGGDQTGELFNLDLDRFLTIAVAQAPFGVLPNSFLRREGMCHAKLLNDYFANSISTTWNGRILPPSTPRSRSISHELRVLASNAGRKSRKGSGLL